MKITMTTALNGLKILDFSTLLPGPFATMYLADMGAEVIHIESPSMPMVKPHRIAISTVTNNRLHSI